MSIVSEAQETYKFFTEQELGGSVIINYDLLHSINPEKNLSFKTFIFSSYDPSFHFLTRPIRRCQF